MKTLARRRFILQATATYAMVGLAWILLSDSLLSALADVDNMVWLSVAKGVFFVAVSAAGFYVALHAVPAAGGGGVDRLIDAFAGGLARGRLRGWLAHGCAFGLTVLALLAGGYLAPAAGEQPLIMLLMAPVILAALLGGLWPGLLATAVAACGAVWLAIPPLHSFAIASAHDLLQWVLLVGNGVAVSLLSELLRRALARAELNRRLLDSLIAGMPDAVFVKDGRGRYLMANQATAAFAGHSVEELLGQDDHRLFADDDASRRGTEDAEIMQAARERSGEEQLRTRDGRELVFQTTRGPVFDDRGRVIGLFGVAHEITARKRAENEIRRLNAELERRVSERTAELQSANSELEDVAYALTHNLRAPLRAIGGFSRLLVDDHGAELKGDAANCLFQILRATDRMGGLLDGILALLRCTRGELRRQTVDISALAQRQLDDLARGELQRRVGWQVEPGLTAVGDPAMLDMAVTHLLDNAWKFTRGRTDAAIRVFAAEGGARAGFCIADNGVGFDMAHGQRLFQAFQRLHREDEFPGIGIGLATVQRIVRRHGGDIRVSASPGAGATFCIDLPRVAADLEEKHDPESHPAGRGQPAGRDADPARAAQDQSRQ